MLRSLKHNELIKVLSNNRICKKFVDTAKSAIYFTRQYTMPVDVYVISYPIRGNASYHGNT